MGILYNMCIILMGIYDNICWNVSDPGESEIPVTAHNFESRSYMAGEWTHFTIDRLRLK